MNFQVSFLFVYKIHHQIYKFKFFFFLQSVMMNILTQISSIFLKVNRLKNNKNELIIKDLKQCWRLYIFALSH